MNSEQIKKAWEASNRDPELFARIIAEACAQQIGVRHPEACEMLQDKWEAARAESK